MNKSSLNNKIIIDKIMKVIFMISAILAALMIVLIIFTIVRKGISPFISNYDEGTVGFFGFATGMSWSMGNYGVLFLIFNTIILALFSAAVSIPISVLTALFIVRIAPVKIAKIMQTVIEVLASIPSIVYGVFGAIIITNLFKNIAYILNVRTFGGTGVASSVVVLSMMTIPTITSVAITAIHSVDKKLIEGSLALGATSMQTNFKVVLTTAKSGIFAGAILGVGRALGEATAVSMVAGNSSSGISILPFDITSTLTTAMMSGIKETYGLDYDIRFSVGLVLIAVIFGVNMVLNFVKKKIGGNIE